MIDIRVRKLTVLLSPSSPVSRRHHAKWRPLTAAGKAAAVAALREVAGAAPDLLADVADVALGFCERWRPRYAGIRTRCAVLAVSGL